MVMTPDWESVGCEFKYRTLISLILSTKLEKHKWLYIRMFFSTVSRNNQYHLRSYVYIIVLFTSNGTAINAHVVGSL